MLGENEDVLIVESQSLDADETVRSSVLEIIKNGKNFQKTIEKLEKEKLIWYLIGPLCKDKDITAQMNLKWERSSKNLSNQYTQHMKNLNHLYQIKVS